MGEVHPCTRPRAAQRLLFLALVSLLALLLAGPAGAGPLTGGFSPTIVGQGADVNGDGIVDASDDANAFYGDTSIIDGKLDCDAWGVVANDGSAGTGTINGADDCSLVGYDGTPDGVTIEVVDGAFQVGDGPLPTVFNAGNPDNADIGDSDFAWSAIDGRVDSNGNEDIDSDDCHAGLILGIDVLSNDNGNSNPCGFASSPNTADNGLLDFNNDQDVTGIDSCSNGCFFGLDVSSGKVQEVECAGFEGDPRHDVIGTSRPDVLIGTAGPDIICGLGGADKLIGAGGRDLLRGGGGADVIRGGDAGDRLFGNGGRDRLNGGAGFDRGFGGAGHDTFVSCEIRHQ
jgi:Ca2+-binding RTX toxin-like protein